jgi:hypothetical protein
MKFHEGDQVEVFNVPGGLSGMKGTICGRVSGVENDEGMSAGWSTYIIRIADECMDDFKKLGYQYSCFGITDACIRRVN